MKPITGVVIIALTIAVAVLGYRYHRETQDNLNIKLEVPKVDIE